VNDSGESAHPEFFIADTPNADQMFVGDRLLYKLRAEYGVGLAEYRGAVRAVVAKARCHEVGIGNRWSGPLLRKRWAHGHCAPMPIFFSDTTWGRTRRQEWRFKSECVFTPAEISGMDALRASGCPRSLEDSFDLSQAARCLD
jgi:hypothetical protein